MKFDEIIGPDNPIIATIAELYCSSLTNIPVTINRQGLMKSWVCLVGFGNYLFTSLILLDELSKKGIVECETLKENRLEKTQLIAKK